MCGKLIPVRAYSLVCIAQVRNHPQYDKNGHARYWITFTSKSRDLPRKYLASDEDFRRIATAEQVRNRHHCDMCVPLPFIVFPIRVQALSLQKKAAAPALKESAASSSSSGGGASASGEVTPPHKWQHASYHPPSRAPPIRACV